MVQPVGGGVVFAVIDNILEYVAIVGVAGHHDAFCHVDGRAVPVAAQLVPGAVMVAVRARVAHLRSQYAFLHADERIHQLKHRTGRVGGLYGTVVHGLVGVFGDLVVVLANIGQLFHVDARRGYQGQDFAGGRFQGHHGAHLAGHELLPVLLELCVNGGDDVLARDSFFVHGAVLERLLNLVAGVAEVDVIAFLPAEILFPRRFDACHAGIVAAAVFAGMTLHVALVYLRHIAQEVATGVHRVLAHAARLTAKSGKLVFDLLKAQVGLGRYHTHHGDSLEADRGAFAVILVHLAPDEFRRYAQGCGQGQGVEGFYLAGAHQDVVGHLVAHQYSPVAVEDGTAGGVDGLIDRGVAVCVLLVAVVQELDRKNGAQQQQDGCSQANEQADMTPVICHRCGSAARTFRVRSDTTRPAGRDAKKRARLNQSGRRPAPSAQMYRARNSA